MDIFHKRYGTWAFIAGAADGIGAGFAEVLASRGMNLLLADNNFQGLELLSKELKGKFGISQKIFNIDLELEDSWKQCADAIRDEDCRLLVYNTAFSIVRRFSLVSHEELDRFLGINNRTMIHLMNEFTNILENKKESGGIILMSSLAGLIGPRFVAPYAGTKGFINLFGEALNRELEDQGIDITVCCAGTTSTPTFWRSMPVLTGMKPVLMEPGNVADYAIRNLGRKARCIAGTRNRFQYFLLTRILPRRLSSWIVSYAMGKLYPGA